MIGLAEEGCAKCRCMKRATSWGVPHFVAYFVVGVKVPLLCLVGAAG